MHTIPASDNVIHKDTHNFRLSHHTVACSLINLVPEALPPQPNQQEAAVSACMVKHCDALRIGCCLPERPCQRNDRSEAELKH